MYERADFHTWIIIDISVIFYVIGRIINSNKDYPYKIFSLTDYSSYFTK